MKFNSLLLFVAFTVSIQGKTQFISTNYYQQTLWFPANSIIAYNEGSTQRMGHFVSYSVYDSLRAGRTLRINNLDSNSRRDVDIKNYIPTRILPYIKKDDLFVYLEAINSRLNGHLSADSIYGFIKQFAAMTNSYGAKLIVCTVPASDRAGDAADDLDSLFRYNTLVRSGAATYGYTVCDIGADTHFDQRSDCSNTDYYAADKLHQASAGQMIIINLIVAKVREVLAALGG